MARKLADDFLLPLNVEEYGLAIEQYEKGILDGYGDMMIENGLDAGLGLPIL